MYRVWENDLRVPLCVPLYGSDFDAARHFRGTSKQLCRMQCRTIFQKSSSLLRCNRHTNHLFSTNSTEHDHAYHIIPNSESREGNKLTIRNPMAGLSLYLTVLSANGPCTCGGLRGKELTERQLPTKLAVKQFII